jgi:hypothetical protein
MATRDHLFSILCRRPGVRFDLLPNGRRVIWIGDGELQIAVSHGGGHIAALRFPGMPQTANPFWQPPWTSLEPEDVTDATVDTEYGGAPEGRLLASILGHSVALDLYGAPSKEEAAGGAVTHGKIGVLPWTWEESENGRLTGRCEDTFARLHFSRQLQLSGSCLIIEERVQNLCAWDRPIGWQQHVSFGPPFYGDGFWSKANCDLGSTHPQSFGSGASLVPGTETHWPLAPRRDGSICDYRLPVEEHVTANDFTGYRVHPTDQVGGFVVGNRYLGFALFYIWPRRFFPWMGIWDEKHARDAKPWNKNASVRAYEFGVSPYPQSRRDMLGRPLLFDQPTYLLLPGAGALWVRYMAGVFSGVAEAGDLVLSQGIASLMTGNREIGSVPLLAKCASSARCEPATP